MTKPEFVPEFAPEMIERCVKVLDQYGSQYTSREKVWGILRASGYAGLVTALEQIRDEPDLNADISAARADALKEAEAKVRGMGWGTAADHIAALNEPAQVRPSAPSHPDGDTPLPGAGGEEDRECPTCGRSHWKMPFTKLKEARAEVDRVKGELAEAQKAAGKDADNIASHARAAALKEAEAIVRTEAIRWSEESYARFAANRAADTIAALISVPSGDPVALADEIAVIPSDGAIYAAESRASDPAGYDAIVTQSVEAVKDESNREIERGVFALLEIAQERIEWLERENNTLAGMKKERDEARQWLESRFAYLPWMTSIDSARADALKEAAAIADRLSWLDSETRSSLGLSIRDAIAALAKELPK